MGIDEKGVVLFQHPAETERDPVRQRHGGTSIDPDDFKVGNFSKSQKDFAKSIIRKQQRIPSGEENIADYG